MELGEKAVGPTPALQNKPLMRLCTGAPAAETVRALRSTGGGSKAGTLAAPSMRRTQSKPGTGTWQALEQPQGLHRRSSSPTLQRLAVLSLPRDRSGKRGTSGPQKLPRPCSDT